MAQTGYMLLWTLMVLGATQAPKAPVRPVYINYTEYWVSPRTTYEDFRLKVYNTQTDPVTIERVDPSCGCVLATIQKNRATIEQPGEIYVAIVSHKVDSLQPITIDVYTSESRSIPKRLYIRRAPKNSLTR